MVKSFPVIQNWIITDPTILVIYTAILVSCYLINEDNQNDQFFPKSESIQSFIKIQLNATRIVKHVYMHKNKIIDSSSTYIVIYT